MVKITRGSPFLPRTKLNQQPSVSAWESSGTPRKDQEQRWRPRGSSFTRAETQGAADRIFLHIKGGWEK